MKHARTCAAVALLIFAASLPFILAASLASFIGFP
jgi:hypothetical protein